MSLKKNDRHHRRRVWLGGIVLVALAALTRYVGLGDLEPWYDEICSWLGARDNLDRMLHWRPHANDEHAPLPFLEIRMMIALLGDHVGVWRLPAATYAVLGIAATYITLGRRINFGVAWWSTLLLIANPYVLEHSREARMYPAWLFYLVLCVAFADVAAQRTLSSPRRRTRWLWWAALGIAFMLVFASTTHGILTVAGVCAWLAARVLVEWHHHRRADAVALLTGSALTVVVFCFNWSAYGLEKLFQQMIRVSEDVGSTLPTAEHLLIIAREQSGYVPGPIGVALWIAALGGIVLLWRRGYRGFASLVLLAGGMSWIGFPPIIGKHFYVSRYLFGMLAVWSLGLGYLIDALWSAQHRRRATRAGVVIALLALGVLWAPVWHDLTTRAKNPVAHALAAIRNQSRPQEVVKVIPTPTNIFLEYYETGEARRGAFEPLTVAGRRAATWVFVENPPKHRRQLSGVLRKYGLPMPQSLKAALDATKGRNYAAIRISSDGVGPVIPGAPARDNECELILPGP